ncbi:MAG: four helix bundle protein [Dehalococcoidia bacterium]
MDEATFKRRTRELGLRVIEMTRSMKRDLASDVLARQIVRSATSVGANYRAACRAKSRADMLMKLSIVEEEADETTHWLEMLRDSNSVPAEVTNPILAEANEITAMTVASIRTLRVSAANPKSKVQSPKFK